MASKAREAFSYLNCATSEEKNIALKNIADDLIKIELLF